ncbi:hypothetical protein [Curtobacterium sp. 9128]|uniref:hypothetical protein n=1 Tax=Curtobacterium sp. 9128 TaxID=1793722 RepID=UPI0011A89C39|nr:hypothetical protein [Curtobacterium sp. 9128]
MRVPRIVTTDDWPEAELRGAVLAGELVAVGECWASVAEPQDPGLRAASFRWSVGDPRIIACGLSATWIWGGSSRPPLPHDACVEDGLRVRRRGAGRVREIALHPADVVLVGGPVEGARVTTPVRTAVDLLRTVDPDDWADRAEPVHGLLVATGTAPTAVRARLRALGTVPMVRQAERRLAGLELRAADGSGVSRR